MRSIFKIVLAGLVLSGAAQAQPIGTVESNGHYTLKPAGQESAARFHKQSNAYFAGDVIESKNARTAINFHGGGGVGLTGQSAVQVDADSDGRLTLTLLRGSLLYAFPDGKQEFEIQVGNFMLSPHAPNARALQVDRGGAFVGNVERLADGNLKLKVRNGELFVTNGGEVRYAVSSGESVGLIDLPERLDVQRSDASPDPEILIQSPERVGTSEEFQVRWQANQPVEGDYVVIAKSGADPDEFETLVNSDEGEVLSLTAPGSAGDYEIRFIDGVTGQVKSFVYLDVTSNVPAGLFLASSSGGGGIGAAGAALAVVGAGTAVIIGTEIADDDDPVSVSP